jgi:hypothetical protein
MANGISAENKIIILKNNPFLAFLNQILITPYLDLNSENLRDIKGI